MVTPEIFSREWLNDLVGFHPEPVCSNCGKPVTFIKKDRLCSQCFMWKWGHTDGDAKSPGWLEKIKGKQKGE